MNQDLPLEADAGESRLPDPSFQLLCTQFATQALMELGELENPISGETEVSLPRAKFTIDLLQVLKDRTEGNLTPEEMQFLDAALYELRLKFVAKQEQS